MLPGPVFTSAVLVRNQETGLSLRPPPGFGEDGTWPPVATEWLPLRWELFEAGGCASGSTLMARELVRVCRQNLAGSVDPLLAEDALDDNFLDDAIFRGTSATLRSRSPLSPLIPLLVASGIRRFALDLNLGITMSCAESHMLCDGNAKIR